jgi:hypothetical protein
MIFIIISDKLVLIVRSLLQYTKRQQANYTTNDKYIKLV